MSLTLPWALFFQLIPFDTERPDIELCLEIWPDDTDGTLYFLFANLLACYVMPMILISICYILIWIKVSVCVFECKMNAENKGIWNSLLLSNYFFCVSKKVSRRDIPGDTKEKDRIQQQSKIKVVKMLALVVILFVLSWLPLYAIFTYKKFGEWRDAHTRSHSIGQMDGKCLRPQKAINFKLNGCKLISHLGSPDPRVDENLNILTPIAQWLGSANSCINPILYAFNEKYRRGFIAIIRSRKCWGRLR